MSFALLKLLPTQIEVGHPRLPPTAFGSRHGRSAEVCKLFRQRKLHKNQRLWQKNIAKGRVSSQDSTNIKTFVDVMWCCEVDLRTRSQRGVGGVPSGKSHSSCSRRNSAAVAMLSDENWPLQAGDG